MRAAGIAVVAILLTGLLSAGAKAACTPNQSLGLARIAKIDSSQGPLFGNHTGYQRASSFLEPKEVVLTFDDGPMPWITKSILDTLDSHCTKATFFSVGRMAIAYPAMTKEILARGHTLGTHTWSHPLNLRRLRPEAAIDEIERGFAAVALAAGQPIAPFFRFPGLNDNAQLLTHLQSRKVATFTVDVISNDSYIHDANRLITYTLAQVEARQGGIVLFHDIKASTARALPVILSELKARGYKVVHMRPAAGFEPAPGYEAQLAPTLAKALTAGKGQLTPFYAGALQASASNGSTVPETVIAPVARIYEARASDKQAAKPASKRPAGHTSAQPVSAVAAAGPASERGRKPTQPQIGGGWAETFSGGWMTTVSPPPTRLRRSTAD